MRFRQFLLWLAAIQALAGIGADAQPLRALTDADISSAVRRGADRSLEPYKLFWRTGREPFTVVAFVYTPYLRVAYWSRLHSAREEIRAQDIPPELMEPVLLVAVPDEPRCCTPMLAQGPPQRVRAAIAPTRIQPGRRPEREHVMIAISDDPGSRPALWSVTELSLLRQFDPDVAGHTSALVAFDLRDVRPGYTIVIEQQFQAVDGPAAHRFFTNGTIAVSDLHIWR